MCERRNICQLAEPKRADLSVCTMWARVVAVQRCHDESARPDLAGDPGGVAHRLTGGLLLLLVDQEQWSRAVTEVGGGGVGPAGGPGGGPARGAGAGAA